MDTKVAVVSIIVEKEEAGRMGIPYRTKEMNIICVAVDAPMDRINALTGALGRLDGVTAKAAVSGR